MASNKVVLVPARRFFRRSVSLSSRIYESEALLASGTLESVYLDRHTVTTYYGIGKSSCVVA